MAFVHYISSSLEWWFGHSGFFLKSLITHIDAWLAKGNHMAGFILIFLQILRKNYDDGWGFFDGLVNKESMLGEHNYILTVIMVR